jgi:hypothetical protein
VTGCFEGGNELNIFIIILLFIKSQLSTLIRQHVSCYFILPPKFFFINILPVHLDIIKVFYSPNDAQMNCLKNNIKIYFKELRHVSVQSHHHQGAHYSCLLKLQLLKESIKINRCVVNVVMWLRYAFLPQILC